jgi:hypothetical protein
MLNRYSVFSHLPGQILTRSEDWWLKTHSQFLPECVKFAVLKIFHDSSGIC